MIKLYNTLSRTEDPLPENADIKLFVCGPTVYDDAHIGHARTYIFFDFLKKYLVSQGKKVFYLQNITDIDDKIIKRAAEAGISPAALAAKFTQSYFEDMKALGIDGVDEYAPATKFIPEIISQVERLIEKGFAYKIDGDGWYFDIAKDEDYGKLSGRTVAQAEDGVSRIDDAIGKKNKGDFCLWKFSQPGEPTWPSESLGAGRPGWHIEDTAISEKFFGPQYDIHGGAVDLKFPHHEAEIAQQESASSLKPFVKIWVHTGFLTVNGEKMSKSVGNFVTIKDFLKKYPAEVLRYFFLRTHYRNPLDYSEKNLAGAENELQNLSTRIHTWYINYAGKKLVENAILPHDDFPECEAEFLKALNDDLNTPQALAILHKITTPHAHGKISDRIFLINKMSKLLGLNFMSAMEDLPPEIKDLKVKYEQFRANKQFVQSDALRKEIEALGYEVRDKENGTAEIVKKRFS